LRDHYSVRGRRSTGEQVLPRRRSPDDTRPLRYARVPSQPTDHTERMVLLTAADVAKRLRVSRQTAYRLMRREMAHVVVSERTIRVTELTLNELGADRPTSRCLAQRR